MKIGDEKYIDQCDFFRVYGEDGELIATATTFEDAKAWCNRIDPAVSVRPNPCGKEGSAIYAARKRHVTGVIHSEEEATLSEPTHYEFFRYGEYACSHETMDRIKVHVDQDLIGFGGHLPAAYRSLIEKCDFELPDGVQVFAAFAQQERPADIDAEIISRALKVEDRSGEMNDWGVQAVEGYRFADKIFGDAESAIQYAKCSQTHAWINENLRSVRPSGIITVMQDFPQVVRDIMEMTDDDLRLISDIENGFV